MIDGHVRITLREPDEQGRHALSVTAEGPTPEAALIAARRLYEAVTGRRCLLVHEGGRVLLESMEER